ncbi:tetratricopeptide repeat protein [Hahella sp. CR1]|uniref:tetratricopeptide repeat protein n=1 Tax=Hahella sp. CR1 TaxID=2992807 RepID=UPI002441C8B0|nr:tetratricopeptide repeat protein [Hahella sp. CR1]MDG9668838.1 tetratricopeptide repeat protein [Hahella sp. CR1]
MNSKEKLWDVQCYYRSGDIAIAIEELKKYLSRGAFPEANAFLGLILWREGRKVAGKIEAQKGIAGNRNNPYCHYVMAEIAAEEGRFETAKKHLQTALKLAPNNAEYHVAMMRLTTQGEEECLTQLSQLARTVTDPFPIFMEMGRLYEQREDWGLANQYLSMAMRLEPVNVNALLAMARICIQREEYAEAETHLLWALSSNQKNREAIALLAALASRNSLKSKLKWRIYEKVKGLGLDAVYMTAALLVPFSFWVVMLVNQGWPEIFEEDPQNSVFPVFIGVFSIFAAAYGVLRGAQISDKATLLKHLKLRQ